jgi:hypothetical protein
MVMEEILEPGIYRFMGGKICQIKSMEKIPSG